MQGADRIGRFRERQVRPHEIARFIHLVLIVKRGFKRGRGAPHLDELAAAGICENVKPIGGTPR